jgi:TPR repeat protein
MFKWLHKVGNQIGYSRQPGRVTELGVPAGGDDAVKWFRKAAEKGTIWGQFNLGMRYIRGEGVLQDYVEAAKWLQKAADQRDGMSQYCLGELYEHGFGVELDLEQAYRLYCLAAGQGIREAEKARYRLQQHKALEQSADRQTQAVYSPRSQPQLSLPPGTAADTGSNR